MHAPDVSDHVTFGHGAIGTVAASEVSLVHVLLGVFLEARLIIGDVTARGVESAPVL